MGPNGSNGAAGSTKVGCGTCGPRVGKLREEGIFKISDASWLDRDAKQLDASLEYCWYSWAKQTESMNAWTRYTFEWMLPGHGQRVKLPAETMSLQNCRVVLVRPQFAGNIGATARIMRNLGVPNLVLVAPLGDPLDPEARKLSTHGEEILHQARIVSELSDALADCVCAVGTSARIGGPVRRQSVVSPRAIMPRLTEALISAPAALVFGPEANGLTDAEVSRCHYLIHIPADASYPALNLAQAVAICLYELRCAWLRRTQPVLDSATLAPFADQERMFAHLREALEAIHFLYEPNGASLMHALRHLLGRAQPTPMEVDLLHGLARQIRWYADEHGPSNRG